MYQEKKNKQKIKLQVFQSGGLAPRQQDCLKMSPFLSGTAPDIGRSVERCPQQDSVNNSSTN